MASSAMTDRYTLDRDRPESQRLDDQHIFWSKNLGYNIHPTIQSKLPPSLRIADIGTGSGAYLLDLANTLSPTSQLDGFDISDKLFPPTHSSNIAFHVQDATHRFPTALHGKYDFVHLRLLTVALDPQDWASVLENTIQLLNPAGGAIQWSELDIPGMKVYHGPLSSSSSSSAAAAATVLPTAMSQIVQLFQTPPRHRTDYGFKRLPEMMRQAGLKYVSHDVISSDLYAETRALCSRTSLAGQLNWARHQVRQLGSVCGGGGGGWTLEKLTEMEKQVKVEIEGGCYVRYDISTAIGFRAS